MTKNPFAATHWGSTNIGFWVEGKVEPLWWTGQGFKDMSKVRAQPEEFPDIAAAERKIRDELLGFIRRWRADQVSGARRPAARAAPGEAPTTTNRSRPRRA